MSIGPTNASGDVADNADRGIAPPGFRLPAATRLGVVRLQIANLARSLAYYERVLGFRTLRRTERASRSLGTVEVKRRSSSCTNDLAPTRIRGADSWGSFTSRYSSPTARLSDASSPTCRRSGRMPGMSDHLVSEALYLTDPDGLGIEVYADRPRSQWTYDGRELRCRRFRSTCRTSWLPAGHALDGHA